MSKVEFKLDKTAFRTEVLQSPGMLKAVESAARTKAGNDSHIKPFIGFDRAKAIIYPNTPRHKG